MEGANEAARRAVNAILDATGSARARAATVWPLREPPALRPARVLDRVLVAAAAPGAVAGPGVGVRARCRPRVLIGRAGLRCSHAPDPH